MSQYDFGTIDPYVVDGVQLADMLNQWRSAIHSMHRGATRPTYAVAGMMWINDAGGATNWIVNVYLGAAGDKPLFTYNTTTGEITVSAAAGGTLAAAALLAQASASPSVRWDATGNPTDQKLWRSTVTAAGALRFGAYNDSNVETASLQIERDGSVLSIMPAGAILDYGGSAAPTGWYLCDGSSKVVATDTRLHGVIGYSFGGGGANFNVPDLRGRVTAGVDGGTNRLQATVGTAVGNQGGTQTHVLVINELAFHNHNYGGDNFRSIGAGSYPGSNAGGASTNFYASSTSDFSPYGTGGNIAHQNTQPTMMVNKIIKR